MKDNLGRKFRPEDDRPDDSSESVNELNSGSGARFTESLMSRISGVMMSRKQQNFVGNSQRKSDRPNSIPLTKDSGSLTKDSSGILLDTKSPIKNRLSDRRGAASGSGTTGSSKGNSKSANSRCLTKGGPVPKKLIMRKKYRSKRGGEKNTDVIYPKIPSLPFSQLNWEEGNSFANRDCYHEDKTVYQQFPIDILKTEREIFKHHRDTQHLRFFPPGETPLDTPMNSVIQEGECP